MRRLRFTAAHSVLFPLLLSLACGCSDSPEDVGSDPETLFVSADPILAAASDDYAYVGTRSGVTRIDLADMSTQAISDESVNTVTGDDAMAAWASRGLAERALHGADVDDSSSLPGSNSRRAARLAIHGERYVVAMSDLDKDGDSVHASSWDNSSEYLHLEPDAGRVGTVAINDTHVFYTLGEDVFAATTSLTSPALLGSVAGAERIVEVKSQGESLYLLAHFARNTQQAYFTLSVIPLTGGSPSTLFSSDGFCGWKGGGQNWDEADALVLDANAAYVVASISQSDSGCNQANTVYRIPFDGSEPQELWRRESLSVGPDGLFKVDDQHIYFERVDLGAAEQYSLVRIPKSG